MTSQILPQSKSRDARDVISFGELPHRCSHAQKQGVVPERVVPEPHGLRLGRAGPRSTLGLIFWMIVDFEMPLIARICIDEADRRQRKRGNGLAAITSTSTSSSMIGSATCGRAKSSSAASAHEEAEN